MQKSTQQAQNSGANSRQIGGDHYRNDGGEQHWDRVRRLGLDYFQAQVTKYVERCWKKNGMQDLHKALHFLEKYIELNTVPVESTAVDLGTSATVGLREARLHGGMGEIERDLSRVEDLEAIGRDERFYHQSTPHFTLEGVQGMKAEYTCRKCKHNFWVDWHLKPSEMHVCPLRE